MNETTVGPNGHLQHNHAIYHPLMAFEVMSAARQNAEAQRSVREEVYRILQDAVTGSGLSWRDCRPQDLINRILIVLPSECPIALLVASFLDLLRSELRLHNKLFGELTQIRLLMALHHGSVRCDDYGVYGPPVSFLVDLLEAAPFRRMHDESDAEFGLIISASIYDDVIQHGYSQIDPADYRLVEPNSARVYFPYGLNGRTPSRSRMRSVPTPACDPREAASGAR